jgi:hypothetical protein
MSFSRLQIEIAASSNNTTCVEAKAHSNKNDRQAAAAILYNFQGLVNDTPFKKCKSESTIPTQVMRTQFTKNPKFTLDLEGEKQFDCDSWLINDFYSPRNSELDLTFSEKTLTA